MDLDQVMLLNNAAISALELFSLAEEEGAKPDIYSLYGLLNKCRTTGGKEMLKQWIKQPLCDLKTISARLDIVQSFNEATENRDSLYHSLLRKIHDLSVLSRRLNLKKASLEDCHKLYKCICTLDPIIEILAELQNCKAVEECLLVPLERSKRELEKFRELIESTVYYNELTQKYCIKADIDENLVSLQEDIDRLKTQAESIVISLRAETNTEAIKLESNSEIGFFFRVTLKGEKNIRGANIKTLKTGKGGGVTFVNSAIERLNRDFCGLSDEYLGVQKEVENNVIETCGGYSLACDTLAERISFLDVLVSFSIVCASSANEYVRPELLEKGTNVFELRECRHPIVESIPFGPAFIPNDVVFEDGHCFSVLTGPNMGGKSTYLKAAAVTIILAQIGCFVPCSSARFSLIESIFCRVGADDIQFKGVSTFMKEMLDMADILKNADENSFVIIDELGRGTSTYDGFGLAFATAERIATENKCLTLFATHFHEMSRLKSYYPKLVQNLKVETHLNEEGEMTILYQITQGLSEQSFGINIARMVGFSEDVVKDAQDVLKELEKGEIDEEEAAARETLASYQKMTAEGIRSIIQNQLA